MNLKKIIKTIGLTIGAITVLSTATFAYNCIEGKYNEELLSEMDKDVIYTKRDKDSYLKIYQSSGDLKSTDLIYEYTDSGIDNNNIIDIKYDQIKDIITFVAYDNKYEDWMQFELDRNGKVTPLNIPADLKSLNVFNEDVSYGDVVFKNVNGSLYKVETKTNKETVLKKYHGFYDSKFASGYTPIKVSDDGKYLFFIAQKHPTAIGNMLEGMLFGDASETYVMNLETEEVSKYVDFHDLIIKEHIIVDTPININENIALA